MANILLIYHQPIVDYNNWIATICFYESLAKELQNYNNNVLLINTLFLKDYPDVVITKMSSEDKVKFIESIQKFNTDIIFTFNNQIVEEIINITECPICVFDADSLDLFCRDSKNLLKAYQDRFYMFSFAPGWEDFNRYSGMGFNEKNIEFLHLATSIRREKLEKVANISFIGSCFRYDSFLEDIKNTRELYNLIAKSYHNNEINYKNILTKPQQESMSIEQIYALFDTRLLVLNSLLDLGLNLYGKGFKDLQESVLLKLAFIDEPVFSLKHNQDIYNSSKINISISHPQCRGYAFPWRIYDIMASNGLLISSYSKLLEEQTKGIVKIPMYKNPYDARDLCKYALNNPNYCEDIILASNEFIEKKGRWKDNFETIQSKVGVKIMKVDDTKSKGMLKICNFSNIQSFTIRYTEFILKFSFLISSKKERHLIHKIKNYKKIKKVHYEGIIDLE